LLRSYFEKISLNRNMVGKINNGTMKAKLGSTKDRRAFRMNIAVLDLSLFLAN